jgi:hypothetical protein
MRTRGAETPLPSYVAELLGKECETFLVFQQEPKELQNPNKAYFRTSKQEIEILSHHNVSDQ